MGKTIAGFILIAMGLINFALNPIAGAILLGLGIWLQVTADRKKAA